MWADFDSRANALEIELVRFERLEGEDSIDDTYCQVGFANGRPVCIELLNPAEQLDLLPVVAERYELDGEELLAVTQAALAAPDRLVELKLSTILVA